MQEISCFQFYKFSYYFCSMLQEKQEMQPLKVFWEKDMFLKIAALTVARWNYTLEYLKNTC